MITENNEAGEQLAFLPGIYLEERNSSIGTGSTAKTAQYRNFWATLLIGEDCAVMVLLNDDFRPTAVKEKYTFEVLRGPQWHYIAEGQKRYALLRPHLDRMLAPAAQAAANNKPQEKPASGNWWGGGAPAAASPQKKAEPKKKNNWWDG